MSAEEPKNAIVTLTVDTERITEKTKNEYVKFSDNMGDPDEKEGDPSDYYSTVDLGKNITWKGKSLNENDRVNITLVAKKPVKGGADILKEIMLGDPYRDPIVVANITDKYTTRFENYNITFMINGDDNRVFTLDPKLQIRQKT